MVGVSQKSMNLLSTITQSYAGVNLDGNARSEFTNYTEPIITTLVEKLGDNLQKVRFSAEEALMSAAGHKEFGVRMILSYLIAETPLTKPKGKVKKPILSNKVAIAKYSFMHKMLMVD